MESPSEISTFKKKKDIFLVHITMDKPGFVDFFHIIQFNSEFYCDLIKLSRH